MKKHAFLLLCLPFGFAAMIITYLQAMRSTALVDYSYQVEIAYRIFSGQVPYRDFMLVLTPGLYTLMAVIMKLTGGYTHWGVVIHSLIVAAATIIISFFIFYRISKSKILTLLLCFMLLPAGQQIITFPNYDVWTTLMVLIAVSFALYILKTKVPLWVGFMMGMTSAGAFLFKQSMGLPFAGLVFLSVLVSALFERTSRWSKIFIGTFLGEGVLFGLFGLWLLWTGTVQAFLNQAWIYPEQTRTPGGTFIALLVEYQYAFDHAKLFLTIIFGLIGISLFLRWFGRSHRVNKNIIPIFQIVCLSAVTIAMVSFLQFFVQLYANGLILEWTLWQAFFGMMFMVEIYFVFRGRKGVHILIFPLVILITIQFGLLSHTIYGSHYGIWPLLGILIAWSYPVVRKIIPYNIGTIIIFPCLIATAASLGWYTYTNRLIYPGPEGYGPVTTAKTGTIAGLSTPHQWVPALEALLNDVKLRIPMQARVAFLPGDDPFFAATGRINYLRCTQFNTGTCDTFNAYLEKDIIDKDIEWIIVKDPTMSPFAYEYMGQVIRDLPFSEQVEIAGTYIIYRRQMTP